MSGHVQGTGHTLESSRIVNIVSTVIECSSHQIILLRSSAFWNQSEDYDENGNCHFTFLYRNTSRRSMSPLRGSNWIGSAVSFVFLIFYLYRIV